jgi:hypothetical protein
MDMLYVELPDLEIEEGTYTNGMIINCHLHGMLDSFDVSDYITWSKIEELVNEHLHSFHFS